LQGNILSSQTQGTFGTHAGGNPNDSYGRGGQVNGVAQRRYKWQLWTKDGTRYEFEEDLWWGWDACQNLEYQIEPYKWLLSKVVDPHQNVITYNYNRETWSGFLKTCPGSSRTGIAAVDRDAWPMSITWGANTTTGAPDRYKVVFDSTTRTYDTLFEGATNQYGNTSGPPPSYNGSPRETRVLNDVQVLSNSQGHGMSCASTIWSTSRPAPRSPPT